VWLIMLAVAVLMTIGPPYGLWQFVYWVPGLSFIRVPSRFMQLGMLALAVLAALGFERITSKMAPRRHLAATALATVLLCAEFATMPVDARPYPLTVPAIDRWMKILPKPFAAVEIPLPQTDWKNFVVRQNAIYMIHSLEHFQPIVQGYSGIEPPEYAALEQLLMRFPDHESIDELVRLKVTYAVVHMDYFAPGVVEDAKSRLDHFQSEGALRLIHTEGQGRVYQIVGRKPD
jgi:hypothetical protein